MMKKIPLISIISALTCSSFVYAGGMGCNNSSFCGSAFIGLEGGYTWNMIDGFAFNLVNGSVVSVEDNQGYTARISAGVLSNIDDQFGVTGEVGWGYYGRTNLNPAIVGTAAATPGTFNIQQTLTGFDTLLGVAFTQPNYSLFLKAGALFQNMQTKTNASIAPFGFPIVSTLNLVSNSTEVLPEIKLGGSYNFNENWAVTAAYLFALGASPRLTGDFNVNTGRLGINSNTQNPSINTVLFGVQYTV